MDDVFAHKAFGNVEPARIDLVEAQELVGQVAHCVADVQPLLALVQVDVAQAVRLHDGQLLVTFGLDGAQIVPIMCRQIDRILRGTKPADIPIEFTVHSGTLDALDIPAGPWGFTISVPWFELPP